MNRAAVNDRPGLRPGQHRMLMFARNFVKHPRMLGSVVPSSRFLVQRMLRHVDWASARLIVECGPGIGNITAEILARMHPDARLVLFDLNAEFVAYLVHRFPDPRLTVLHRSATDIDTALAEIGLGAADHVISGLPFSAMPVAVGEQIVAAAERALAPGGRLIAFEYAARLTRLLKPCFARVNREFEPLNIPPARVHIARKQHR